MLKKKSFCFDEKRPVFVKNLEVKISLGYKSAYVIYEWYLVKQLVDSSVEFLRLPLVVFLHLKIKS